MLDIMGLSAAQRAGEVPPYGDQRRLEIARALATARRSCCWTNPPPA
jgi:ABC-type branched-subunit amino acid transport system ATPase component